MAPDVCPHHHRTASYSIKKLSRRSSHTLQELCGQGLVMRFGKAAFENPEIGHRLAELLPGHGVSGAVKEQLMNFIWDLTTSSLAGRVALFEERQTRAPPPVLRERLFQRSTAATTWRRWYVAWPECP